MARIPKRVGEFCEMFGLKVPILLAPMAGACPASLSIAVVKAGGMGACGALLMTAKEIAAWAAEFRKGANGAFQINLWIPDPPPVRDAELETRVRSMLAKWGPEVGAEAGDAMPHDFGAQFEAVLAVKPAVASSIMGIYPADFVKKLKRKGIAWLANVTTVAEARIAAEAGADAIVAQGSEAGGHRGSFVAAEAERRQVGLFSLLPAVVDAVKIPVIATGGIADGRGAAAAMMLGASAVQIGTGFLRSPEAKTHGAWADALARTAPEGTVLTRAFSGRAGRSIETDYVKAAHAEGASAPYPVQRGLTAGMRAAGAKAGDVHRMQVWAGQSAAMARAEPAGEIVAKIWAHAKELVG